MIGVTSSGNTGRLQRSFDHATQPDSRSRTKLGLELAKDQQLRHEAAEVRDDRLPDRGRIGPEDSSRLVCIVRVVPRRGCKGCRQSLDHGGSRLIAYSRPIRSVSEVPDPPHHDRTAAPLRMVSLKWSSFASNSGATPFRARSSGTILLRTPMPRASA